MKNAAVSCSWARPRNCWSAKTCPIMAEDLWLEECLGVLDERESVWLHMIIVSEEAVREAVQ